MMLSKPEFLSIANIADWLHPRSSRWKALAMLEAYFDDSGTHNGAAVALIGGFVGTKLVWEEFERSAVEPIADHPWAQDRPQACDARPSLAPRRNWPQIRPCRVHGRLCERF